MFEINLENFTVVRGLALLLLTGSALSARADPPVHLGDFIPATQKMKCDSFDTCKALAIKYYQYLGALNSLGEPNAASHYGAFSRWREHHFPTGATPVEDRISYYNRGDLGIGRDMHCRTYPKPTPPGIPTIWAFACYVSNYTDGVDGHDFSDSQPGLAIANAVAGGSDPHSLFATVAMEVEWLEGLQGFGAGPEVKFLAFNAQGVPVPVVKLDSSKGKSNNQAVPGTCLVCHGGYGAQGLNTKVDVQSNGTVLVRDGKFLPFDTTQFLYGDGTRKTPNATEEDTLRRLNQQIRNFYSVWSKHPIKELIDGWYAGCGLNTVGCVQDTKFVPKATCTNDQPRSGSFETCGWATGVPPFAPRKPGFDIRAFYLGVPATYCRSCHIAAPEQFNVQSFTAWNDLRTVVDSDVRGIFKMPHAEATFGNYWNDGAAQTLLSQYLDDIDVLSQKQRVCLATCASALSTCLSAADDLDGRPKIQARAACFRTNQVCRGNCRRNP